MRFGLFGSAQSSSENLGAGVGQGFHDYIDYNVEAEALSYYSTFLVELHFTGWSQISATLNLLTWLAALTKTLRLGTAVLVLPWDNPHVYSNRDRDAASFVIRQRPLPPSPSHLRGDRQHPREIAGDTLWRAQDKA